MAYLGITQNLHWVSKWPSVNLWSLPHKPAASLRTVLLPLLSCEDFYRDDLSAVPRQIRSASLSDLPFVEQRTANFRYDRCKTSISSLFTCNEGE